MSEDAGTGAEKNTGAAAPMPIPGSRWPRLKGPAVFAVVALAVIWGGLPRVPAEWGIRFGTPYLTFFTLAALGAASFFLLLNWGPIRQPASAGMTFASILFVYVATVGGMVAFGYWYYPQFQTPGAAATKQEAGETAAEMRGRAVFLNPAFACFACHTIEALGVRGGQRGPDLSDAGKRAERRKPGMSAADYLRESIVDPWACFTPLPASGLAECQPSADPAKTYPQLMPPVKERLSGEQLDDLIAFLMSLKGAREDDGKRN
ncbi:MAG: c-type cytochrome [Betaproteobacteria bacterium]|nr:c-type cytochrome [Betaproteobacteria bacterium]